ncbi:RNB domain-containing ribonuclease [Marinomonas sp. GJ51-6]|uniref:RNB domain-containing ribonuclease n=1 Tax=Marinomonas sp. GJ51-6 TaxID=2992802 RepID=UPI002934BD39|nr:RNB domain-containing ribonuclease [Marinomonas sp. GJ51-6]WOD08076.1 RNB domain-containing ribonuclease [Marinomonas sp. GJ51-6]
MLTLRTYLGLLGLELTGGAKPTPADYAMLSEAIKDRPDARSIQTMMLRSMSQAVYQADNMRYFGLNYEAYTHFTSPIRRYPDLLVHRAIRYLIRGEGRPVVRQAHRVVGSETLKERKIYGYNHADMDAFGDSCSVTERRADEATRDVEAWLKCQYVEQHLGEPFDGVVTAVTSFGLFVELQGLFVDGLVHISGLGQDYFVHDMEHQAIIGERTGRVFRLGDTLKVKVANVNLEQRKIDLSLDDAAPRTRKKVERNDQTELEMQLAQLPPIELGGRSKPKSSVKGADAKAEAGKDSKESSGKAKKKRRPPVSKGKRIRQKKSASAASASKPSASAAKKPKKPKKPKKSNAKPKAKD